MKPLVSITVTTKNEEKNIDNCLKSIKEQTYKNIEIIVIDNNSKDKTKEIAKKYTELVFDKGPERSAQRNFGMIKKSKGKFVMFLDADMILPPFLVENCVKFIQKNKCIALYIPEIVLGKNYFSRVRRFERSFYNGTVIDVARFFLRKEFVNINGFDESMSGPEDWDLDKRIKEKGKVCLLNNNKKKIGKWVLKEFIKEKGVNPEKKCNVIYHNESEFNLHNYLDKKNYYSKDFSKYVNKWGKEDFDIKKQLGLNYRLFGVFFEKGKWKKLFFHPFLTLGMYYLRFRIGLNYLMRREK